MLVFSSLKSRRSGSRVLQFYLSFTAMLWVSNAWAQPGGLGCLVDAGLIISRFPLLNGELDLLGQAVPYKRVTVVDQV